MQAQVNIVQIQIMGREFALKCPNNEIAELKAAAQYLEEQIRLVQGNNKTISIDKAAITAALNIIQQSRANEQQNAVNFAADTKQILNLTNKIKAVL